MVKKGKGKGKNDDWDDDDKGVDFAKPIESASSSLLDGGEPEPEVSDFMAQVMNASKKKQSKKKRKDEDFEAAISENLAGDDAPAADAEDPEPEGGKGKGKGKSKGKGKKDQEETPAAEETPAEPEEEEPAQKGGKGGKGKKNKKNKEEEFWNDIDKIQKGELEPEEKPQPKGKQQAQPQQQQQQQKQQGQPQKSQPQPAAAPAASAPAKAPAKGTPAAAAAAGKKNNSPAAAIKLMLQKQKEEEERLRKLEEEEQRRWQEEENRRLEEERKKEELKQKKKEKERQKIEELKKQGKYMTKAEKERQAILEERRAKLAVQSGVNIPGGDQAAPAEGNKPKKVVYGKRKKPQPGKQDQANAEAEDKGEEEEQEPEREESSESQSQITTPQQSEEGPESWESWEDIDVSAPKVPEPAKPAPKAAPKATSAAKTPAPAPAALAAAASKQQQAPQKAASASAAPAAKKPAQKLGEESEEESSDEDSEGEDDSDEDSEDDEEHNKKLTDEERKEQARERRLARFKEAMANRSKDDLRSPICCILGHVDTGKTKLLDKIRQTNVQENEAGGITQQIGATYFPGEIIREKISPLNLPNFEVKVPGLLIIDTPGHESFTNLRSRGSSLCNIAILVIDIMHYLEPQTIESLNLLRQRKTPFIVALNKIDRIYSWQAHPNMGFQETLALQSDSVQREFEDRLSKTMLALAEQGLNAELYTRNQDFRKYVSICPTSAITGEGIPDMIMLLVQLTQKHMSDQLMYLSELEATVLEVKVIEGQGTTIDVVLSNGVLREGDKIAVCGMNGPIITNVRALLTPQPLRELRVKSQYVHHKEVKAALGVKISAPGLEKAVAGSRLMVIGPDDDEDEVAEEIMSDLADLLKSLDKSGKGVSVQASTLGSLEALLAFLKQMKIPVFNINIGPVHKKDVMRASIMLEHQKEYATMLCFDVEVEKEAQKMADELGVRIFTAEIIYHLFDQFTKYITDIQEQRKKDLAPAAVFPCVLKIVPGCIFNKRSPILIGVTVVEGNLRIGTPLCVPARNQLLIGKCTSIEINHKAVDMAKKGQDVAIRIELPNYETPKMVGRHFEATDDIVSQISRESINILKETFRDEVTKEEWALIIKLKKTLGIL